MEISLSNLPNWAIVHEKKQLSTMQDHWAEFVCYCKADDLYVLSERFLADAHSIQPQRSG
jgi:hypothetical protein